MNQILGTAARTVAFLMIVLLWGFSQGQAEAQAPATTDAETVALQNRLKALQFQKEIDTLTAQEQVLEKQQQTAAPALTTDAEMAAAENSLKVIQLKKQIEALKVQQLALLNPPAKAAAPDCPPAHKESFMERLKRKAQEAADRQLNKVGQRVDQSTGGTGKESPLPTTTEIDASLSPCPAGTVANKK